MLATKHQAEMLFTTSFLSGYSSLVAYQHNLYDLSISSGCVFLTSVLYWRHPQKNWIRTLDIATSLVAIVHHLIRSYPCQPNPYPLHVLGCVLLYPLSWYFYFQKKYWLSIYCHALMHLYGNLSNLHLYERLSQQ